ncbi:MAG: hypothetical protein Tsb005_20220 [Gammaproteobacteria bacterium]
MSPVPPLTANMSATTPHVANLFFQGTGCHREDCDPQGKPLHNTITQLFAHTEGPAKRLFDGVGSQPRLKNSAHPTPGTYVYVPDRRDPFGGVKRLTAHLPTVTRWLGSVLGVGVDANVVEAYQYLQQLCDAGYPPNVVNLTGFSRGAYTALIVANLIAELWPDIEVNLCLFDTVPGPLRKHDIRTKLIPRTVKRCLLVMHKHEDGSAFEVMDATRLRIEAPETTHVTYEVLPGCHGSTMNFDEPPHDVLPRLATIVAHDFLQRCGTRFNSATPPPYAQNAWYRDHVPNRLHAIAPEACTSVALLASYWQLQQHEHHYQGRGYSRYQRDFVRDLARYVPYPAYFISRRQAELCQHVLPLTFDYCCQQGRAYRTRYSTLRHFQHAVQRELQQFMQHYPAHRDGLHQQLRKFGITWHAEQYQLPPHPCGEPVILKRQVLDALPLASNAFERLAYQLQSGIDAYRHHRWTLTRDKKILCDLQQRLQDLQRHTALTDEAKYLELQQAIYQARALYAQSTKASSSLGYVLTALVAPEKKVLLDALTLLETSHSLTAYPSAVQSVMQQCRTALQTCLMQDTVTRDALIAPALALQPWLTEYPELSRFSQALLRCAPPVLAATHAVTSSLHALTRLQWQARLSLQCVLLLHTVVPIKPQHIAILQKKVDWLTHTRQQLAQCMHATARRHTLRDVITHQLQTAYHIQRAYHTQTLADGIRVLQHCKYDTVTPAVVTPSYRC